MIFFFFFCALFLLCKIKSFVVECSRAMLAMRAIKEIRSDASPSHSLLRLVSFFLLFCLFIFCLYLCCLFPPPFSLSVSPSFSLTPFLWLAVSLGLCTFQAGNSEALSKHQLPRSAQRNPSWLPLRCRPPCLPTLNFPSTASLTYELLEHHSLSLHQFVDHFFFDYILKSISLMYSHADLTWKVHRNSSEFNLCSTLSRRTFLHPSTAREV